jgi:hypothetical protein
MKVDVVLIDSTHGLAKLTRFSWNALGFFHKSEKECEGEQPNYSTDEEWNTRPWKNYVV